MNIYDIAKEAGVSIATVSRVLNNKPNISPKTLNKVQSVLRKYNYTPNSIARGLVTKSMSMVGVIVEDIRNPQYTNTAYSIEHELYKKGYICIVCNVSVDDVQTYIKTLAESQVDGLIIIGSVFMTDQTIQAIYDYIPELPIVIVNGSLPNLNVTSLLCDDKSGIMQCVNHLYQRGHKKIIYVNDNDTDSAQRKVAGYKLALYENDIQEHALILKTTSGFHGGFEAGEIVFREYTCGMDYTAIIFPEDLTALGCISSLTLHGLRVPEDVAITGFGNSPFRTVGTHLLTTVNTHLDLLGVEAVRCLCLRLNKEICPNQLVLTPDLALGETT